MFGALPFVQKEGTKIRTCNTIVSLRFGDVFNVSDKLGVDTCEGGVEARQHGSKHYDWANSNKISMFEWGELFFQYKLALTCESRYVWSSEMKCLLFVCVAKWIIMTVQVLIRDMYQSLNNYVCCDYEQKS